MMLSEALPPSSKAFLKFLVSFLIAKDIENDRTAVSYVDVQLPDEGPQANVLSLKVGSEAALNYICVVMEAEAQCLVVSKAMSVTIPF